MIPSLTSKLFNEIYPPKVVKSNNCSQWFYLSAKTWFTISKNFSHPSASMAMCAHAPYALIPMLLSTCFHCHMHKIGTHSEGKFFLQMVTDGQLWWLIFQKKFLTKQNHKKIASMSHLHAFLPMLYAHIPMLPFPCSCLDASIMTCLKLALTASGIRFLQMITVMIDVVEYWNHVLNFFWQQRQLTDDDKKTATKNCHTITSPRSISMLTGDFLVMNIYREFNMA